jgi:Right handed beta helix region
MKSIPILLLLFTICLVSVASAQQQLSHSSNTYYVKSPNGSDDTANIQAALDACVVRGKGCTVQLAAGRYFTKQLVAYNFQGTFKGMGKDRTTIEALPNLPVNLVDWYESACAPNLTTCRWSTLIMFVDGDIHVSDLTVKITAPPGTATTGTIIGGSLDTDLMDVIRFMGQRRTDVCVERVAIEGLPDNSPTSWGFNILNGIIYAGELPRSSAPLDFYVLSGTFTVRNSFFKNITAGTGLIGFNKDSRVTIGGSHSTGNKFENVSLGIALCSSENSVFDVSYNISEGTWDSLWVAPWQDAFVPNKPSLYFIHGNTFKPSGPYADGIYLLDGPTTKWIHAVIYNNNIEAQDIGQGGIIANNTKSAVIWNNTITGTGADAIGLWGATLSTVIHNDVSDFTADPGLGLAQINLDPSTSYDLVVCSNPNDTVLDQGTMNKVIGCKQPAASAEASTMSAAPSTAVARPDRPRRKPPFR